MANGLSSSGFNRQTLSEIITEIKDTIKERFGTNINTAENSYIDKQVTIFAERESSVWEVLEDVYYSQTLAGAEDKYLDDILSKRGVFRNGKTSASGSVQMTLNSLANYTDTFAIGDLTILDGTFSNSAEFKVAGSIFAQKIKNTDVPSGTYTFTILNPTTQATESLVLTLTSNVVGSTALNTFYQSIKTFIVDNTIASNEDVIQIDTVNGILYIGYNTSLALVGLNSVVDFKSTPVAGERIIQFDVKAVETGLNAVAAGTVTSVSPSPTGFVSITNISDFFSGSDVESDSAYRARAAATAISGLTATRSAIIAGILAVDGVKNVKLIPNPTNTTTISGIPPYHLLTVVYGGTTEDISTALYNLIGCPTNTYGTVSYTVTTEDNSTEIIKHSKAVEKPLSVRVRYKTANSKQLTDSEKTLVSQAILALADTFNINSTVFNVQLFSAVTSQVSLSRFVQLYVETKDEADSDTSYSTADIVPDLTEICVIPNDNITYLQIL